MKKILFVVVTVSLLALGCAGFGHHGGGGYGHHCPMHKACACGPDCKCPHDGKGGCGCKMGCENCPMHKGCACGPDCKCPHDGKGHCCQGDCPRSAGQ